MAASHQMSKKTSSRIYPLPNSITNLLINKNSHNKIPLLNLSMLRLKWNRTILWKSTKKKQIIISQKYNKTKYMIIQNYEILFLLYHLVVGTFLDWFERFYVYLFWLFDDFFVENYREEVRFFLLKFILDTLYSKNLLIYSNLLLIL